MTAQSGEGRLGGCRCGRVRFVLSGGPVSVRACHCSDCRKASGAPYSVFVEYALSDMCHSGEEPAEFRSGRAIRAFCAECGSPLTYRDPDLNGRVFILIGALDDPCGLVATEHAFVDKKVDGVIIPDNVVLHARFSVERPGER